MADRVGPMASNRRSRRSATLPQWLFARVAQTAEQRTRKVPRVVATGGQMGLDLGFLDSEICPEGASQVAFGISCLPRSLPNAPTHKNAQVQERSLSVTMFIGQAVEVGCGASRGGRG